MTTTTSSASQAAEPKTFGKYILTDRIGKGGMAEIFRAKVQGASGFEKECVIKRMLPALSDDPGFTDMMVREAKILVSLRHQNIVQVYELGEVEGRYYIAMEYIHGRDLRAVLSRCAERQRAFPIAVAVAVVLEVLRALEYAHRVPDKGGRPLELVHRDVSPTNLMVSFEGEVKVLDFGIAKVDVGDFVTREGLIKGNCPYMSPEQVAGSELDQRSDLFSLGSTFYEMLTGKRAFEAPTYIAVMQRIWADEPTRLDEIRPDVPRALADIIHRMLEKEKEKRYQNAVDLHEALASAIERKEVTIASAFEVAAFMRELFGEALLGERRSIPDDDRPKMPTVRAAETRAGTDAGVTPIDAGTMPLPRRKPGRDSVSGRLGRGTLSLRGLASGGRPHWSVIVVGSALLGAIVVAGVGGSWQRVRPQRSIMSRDEPTRPPEGAEKGQEEITAPPVEVVPRPPEPERPRPEKVVPVGTGYLTLNTYDENGPIWAHVWIDNRRIDKPTPLVDYSLPAGPHRVKMQNPAYPAKTILIRVPRGGRARRIVNLAPAAGGGSGQENPGQARAP